MKPRRYSKPKKLMRLGVPSRYYYVRITVGSHRTWRSTRRGNYRAACDVVSAWELADAHELAGDAIARRMAVSDALDAWWQWQQSYISERTHRPFKTYYRHFIRLLPSVFVQDITVKEVQHYFEARAREGASATTRNNERRRLVNFFQYCLDNEWITRSPMRAIRKFRERRRLVRSLSLEEEERLMQVAATYPANTYGYILCLLETGMRSGTVRSLEWQHIDWRRQEWRIPAAIMKSREDFVGRPIPARMFEWLHEHRCGGGLVFPGQPCGPKRWKRIVELAGVSWLRPHDLRRSFVSRCRRAGIDMETTMFLSDHRDVQTVIKCYREVSPEDARNAVSKLQRRSLCDT